MNKHKQFPVVFLLTSLLIFCFPTIVQAIPPLPSSFYGFVVLNDADLPEGTTIEVVINGQVVVTGKTQMYQGQSVYAVDIPGDDLSSVVIEGGRYGEVIALRVGGNLAEQTGTWKSGTNTQLNLTASSAPIVPQPSHTPVPTLTSTSSLVTMEPSATMVLGQITSPTPVTPESTLTIIGGAVAGAATPVHPAITITFASDPVDMPMANEEAVDMPQKLAIPLVVSGGSEGRSGWLWIMLPIGLVACGFIGHLMFGRKKHSGD